MRETLVMEFLSLPEGLPLTTPKPAEPMNSYNGVTWLPESSDGFLTGAAGNFVNSAVAKAVTDIRQTPRLK